MKLFRRTAEMATKALEYKARRRFLDRCGRFGEKAIANRTKRAHGECMHNDGIGAKLSAKDRRA